MRRSPSSCGGYDDLRQPVQSLVLLMALIERQIAANPEARSTLAMMQKALDGLNSLLTAILDVSRLDAGVEAHPEPVDLAAMLRRLALEYQPSADKVGLVLRVRGPGLWASADPALLERAIRNLIDNAIRNTRTGGVLLGLRRRNGRRRVRIDVVDTGIGIPRERQADIFEEFVQISNPGRHWGLDSDLDGDRRPDRETHRRDHRSQFQCRAGIALLSAASGRRCDLRRDGGRRVQFEDPGGRVLIIEDSAIVLQSLETALAQWGYETVAASTEKKRFAWRRTNWSSRHSDRPAPRSRPEWGGHGKGDRAAFRAFSARSSFSPATPPRRVFLKSPQAAFR